jgi:hypothetical protein
MSDARTRKNSFEFYIRKIRFYFLVVPFRTSIVFVSMLCTWDARVLTQRMRIELLLLSTYVRPSLRYHHDMDCVQLLLYETLYLRKH